MDCLCWHVLSNCHNLLWKLKLTMLMDQSTYRFYSCQNLIKTYFLNITRILKICLSIVWRCSFLKYILHDQPWMDGRAHFTFCLYLLPLTFFYNSIQKCFHRKLYWIQKKNGSSLFQSNLDGSHIVELRQMNPDICSIEYTSGLIYCLTNQKKLVAFNPTQKVTTIIRSSVSKWTSLTVFQKHIIFTDYSNDVIGRIPIDPSLSRPADDLLRVEHPFNAKILHPDVQKGWCRKHVFFSEI